MSKKYTQEDFLKKAKEIHGDSIDFSNFIYTKSISKGLCKCNICGNEWNARADVILRGCGCRKCFEDRYSKSKKLPFDIIQNRIIGKGNFVKIIEETYIDTKHKCTAKCEKCGHTWQVKPNDLINGHSCPICAKNMSKHSQEEAIKKLVDKYGNRFIYNEAVYNGCHEKITLICSECGKEVTTSYNRFVSVDVKCTCSDLFKKSHLEREILNVFDKLEINYEYQKKFDWFKHKCGSLSLDFYIPNRSLAIECQGSQHFLPKSFGCRDDNKVKENFMLQKERDIRKRELCKEHGIELIYFLEEKYIKYVNDNNVYFTDINELIEYVNKEN